MNKMLFEDVYLVNANLQDEVKKEGDKWVPIGTKKLVLTLLIDVRDNDLSSGKVKYITSIKEPSFDVAQLLGKLTRFDKLQITANVHEYGDKTDYKFYKLIRDGVDLTAVCSKVVETNEPMPF